MTRNDPTRTPHLTADGYPVNAGEAYWDNSLRLVTVTGVATYSEENRNPDSDMFGQVTYWHDTTDGMADGSRLAKRHPFTGQTASFGEGNHDCPCCSQSTYDSNYLLCSECREAGCQAGRDGYGDCQRETWTGYELTDDEYADADADAEYDAGVAAGTSAGQLAAQTGADTVAPYDPDRTPFKDGYADGFVAGYHSDASDADGQS